MTVADVLGKDYTGQTYNGDLDLSFRKLTSLKGSPKVVKGHFICSNNKLESLEYCPIIIKGSFNCSNNLLKNLNNGPRLVKLNYNCSHNILTSLEGATDNFINTFDCSNNKIESLDGSPRDVKYFICKNNNLKSIKGVKLNIIGIFDASFNKIKSLDNDFIAFGESINLIKNGFNSKEVLSFILKNFKKIPIECVMFFDADHDKLYNKLFKLMKGEENEQLISFLFEDVVKKSFFDIVI